MFNKHDRNKPFGFRIASKSDLILGVTAFWGKMDEGAGEFRSGLGGRFDMVSFSGTRSGFDDLSIDADFLVEDVFEEQQSSSSSVSTSSRSTEGKD